MNDSIKQKKKGTKKKRKEAESYTFADSIEMHLSLLAPGAEPKNSPRVGGFDTT